MGTRHPELLVPRRPGRRLVHAGCGRAPDRARGAGPRGQGRGGRGDQPVDGSAGARPRPPGQVHQHAPGAQGDLADERRHLDTVGLHADGTACCGDRRDAQAPADGPGSHPHRSRARPRGRVLHRGPTRRYRRPGLASRRTASCHSSSSGPHRLPRAASACWRSGRPELARRPGWPSWGPRARSSPRG